MSSRISFGSWVGRNKWYFIIGVPLLGFALAPFPFGCAMIYPIGDTLRGHPEGRHGTQPQEFVGLWIREEVEMYDFRGQAFYLMPNGRVAGTAGMTLRRWHFDDKRLFIDSVSRCGNCYRGNVTTEHTIRFLGPDELLAAERDRSGNRGITGKYRRVEITDNLKSEMDRLSESKDENQSFKARSVLRAIEHFETLSKLES